jgi:hypothetical protein
MKLDELKSHETDTFVLSLPLSLARAHTCLSKAIRIRASIKQIHTRARAEANSLGHFDTPTKCILSLALSKSECTTLKTTSRSVLASFKRL